MERSREIMHWKVPSFNAKDLLLPSTMFFLVAVLVLPWSPFFPAADLESSWKIALNYASAERLRFGTDLVFTFGPFSAAYTRAYYPGTYLWAFFVTTLLSALLALSFVRQLAARKNSLLHSFIWLTAISLVSPLYMPDALFLIAPYTAFLVLQHDKTVGSPSALSWLSLLALAAISLVKTTFAIAAIGVLLINCLHKPRAGYRGALAFSIYVISVAAMWWASGQDLSALPSYLISSREIVSGYSEAMASEGPVVPILAYVIGSAIAAYSVYTRAGVAACATASFLLFLAFKAAYVRNDIHGVIGASMLLLFGALPIGHRRARIAVMALGAFMLLLGFTNHGDDSFAAFAKKWRAQPRDASRGIRWLVRNPEHLESHFNKALAQLANQHPLPEVKGNADSYSFHQAELLANRIPWNPRPVIQSYSAYTPSLAHANAMHLADSDRPANLFFKVEPIDGRFPAMDDGPSWPLIWAHYRLAGKYDLGLHLVSRQVPKAWQKRPLQILRGSLREFIPLPDVSGLLWVEFSLSKNAFGILSSVLFRPPVLLLELEMGDQTRKTFRLISGVASAGFVMSPAILTTEDFERTFPVIGATYEGLQQVRAFRISQAGSIPLGYSEEFDVRLSVLEFR